MDQVNDGTRSYFQRLLNFLSSPSPKRFVDCRIFYSVRSNTCISYEAINRAFSVAREITRLSAPPSKSKELTDIETDVLGRTLVETSRILAKESVKFITNLLSSIVKSFRLVWISNRFNLPADAVHSGLPLIDTRHTAIAPYCPVKYERPQCKVQRYREVDGMCNNLESAHWGAVMAPFRRLLPPNYRDGEYTQLSFT